MVQNVKESWYALSATYGRELKAKQFLDDLGIENFVPMRQEVRIVEKRKIKKFIPVVKNLIFVKSHFRSVLDLKQRLPYLQFLVEYKDSRRTPIIINDHIMDDFMKVVNSFNEQLSFETQLTMNIKEGVRVRIKGGQFDGVEGIFVKVIDSKKHKIVVCVNNVIYVIINNVSERTIQILN